METLFKIFEKQYLHVQVLILIISHKFVYLHYVQYFQARVTNCTMRYVEINANLSNLFIFKWIILLGLHDSCVYFCLIQNDIWLTWIIKSKWISVYLNKKKRPVINVQFQENCTIFLFDNDLNQLKWRITNIRRIGGSDEGKT